MKWLLITRNTAAHLFLKAPMERFQSLHMCCSFNLFGLSFMFTVIRLDHIGTYSDYLECIE